MNVVFEEQAPHISTLRYEPRGIAGWLLTHHVVRTVSQAQTFLATLTLIFFITSCVLWYASFTSTTIDTHKGLGNTPMTRIN